jgi:glycosyltransferase involved in cell wall biosynthesis
MRRLHSTLDILFVALVADPALHGLGGLQGIVADQARWLAAAGHRVRLVTTCRADGLASDEDAGVARRFLPVTKLDPAAFRVADWHRATVAAWPEVLAEGRPDIVHGHAEAELGLWRAGLIGPAAQLPVVSTVYGSPLAGLLDNLRIASGGGGRPRSAWRRLRAAAGVLPTFGAAPAMRRRPLLALSRRSARLVALSYARRDVAVVYPGVDPAVYRPAGPAERAAARRRWDLPAGAWVGAVVGRLGVGKGFDTALRAFAAGAPEPAWLILAGDGPAEAALRAQAERLGVAGRVRFTGPLLPAVEAYHAADALLFPTRHEESFGLVVAEAMACGLPVLASRRGAVPEVLGGAGELLPAADRDGWAHAIARLVADPEQAGRWGEAGRRRAVADFDRGLTVAQLEAIYAQAIAGSRRA